MEKTKQETTEYKTTDTAKHRNTKKRKAKKKTTAKQTLTVKQKAFIHEYIKNHGDASKAAIKAGYSKHTSRSTGYENLQKPHIKAEIDKRLKEMEAKAVASSTEIMQLLTGFARGNITEEQIVVESSGNGYSSARIMDRKISIKDRISALDKMARIHGLYNDRMEITQEDRERSDVHQKTLEALKGGRVIEGFSDDEETEDSIDD